MKPETRKFERQFIRTRNAIERKGLVMARRMITAQYQWFLDRVKQTDISNWTKIVDQLPEAPARRFFEVYYPMSARLGVMTRKQMLRGRKSVIPVPGVYQVKGEEEDAIYEAIFQNNLSRIVAMEAGEKITTITATSADRIKGVIRGVFDQADTEGWGIDQITSNLYLEVGKNLRGNGYARARAIAQTEIISASNQASKIAADSTGYEYKKFWSTSGLTGIRPTHIEAEAYSDQVNGIPPDGRFPNGLLYPGDPAGPPEEVINCRCTCLYEIV